MERAVSKPDSPAVAPVLSESKSPQLSFSNPIIKVAFGGLTNTIITLLVIIYMTMFILIVAERGRAKLPAEPLNAAAQALTRTGGYLFDHPQTYTWNKQELSSFSLVLDTLKNSAGLLLLAMFVAAVLGIGLGFLAAKSKGRIGSSLVVVLSVLGMSTPSFLLGMFFWIINIYVIHRWLGLKGLPQAGFGWDLHMLMPALVLAVRPLAQIAQVTYVSLTDIFNQDYIRTAKAKGLSPRLINNRHAIRNVLIPIFTAMGTSIRFSLASLPVVELFFEWPGVGATILDAIRLGNAPLITDLIVSLGLFFLLFNLFLDILYPIIDPRLRKMGGATEQQENPGFRDVFRGLRDVVYSVVDDVLRLLKIRKPTDELTPLLAKLEQQHNGEEPARRKTKLSTRLMVVFGNPSFLIGSLLVIGFLGMAIFGEGFAQNSPFLIHGVTKVDGVIQTPPFKPSASFPWGSDHIGRDVQAFVLAGAKRTLLLAFFAMLARIGIGSVLGIIAGWWQESWIDRFLGRLMNIWAAFPITIFAMLIIEALGIQQGIWVFIVALCVVGWGEVTQFVRAQTIRIKPQLYIEAARSLGARPGHLLAQQVFPNMVSSIVILAALEMGGILLLLAELGYLDIFVGGGFTMELFIDQRTHFSDVPEWGAMLANIRQWWRSYPWMAWYPGVAFFLAIISFNLFGEGLRRFLEESRVNLSRAFNRYTFLGGLMVISLASFTLQSATPLNLYRSQAKQFNTQNVMVDIGVLTHATFEGREPRFEGHQLAASYIARRMQENGLFPITKDKSFTYIAKRDRFDIVAVPTLEILDGSGTATNPVYHKDFSEDFSISVGAGEAVGQVVGIALGPESGDITERGQAFRGVDLYDRVVITRPQFAHRVPNSIISGMLIIAEDEKAVLKKYLPIQRNFFSGESAKPNLMITPELADQLLATAGSSLAKLDKAEETLGKNELFMTKPGVEVRFSVEVGSHVGEYQYVVGVLPGTGAQTESGVAGVMMDAQAIVVAAHLDGLGVAPDGTLYPGANDNASGVATLLEMARLLKQAENPPKKTIIFIAWSGAERGEELSITEVMNAFPLLNNFNVEGVIELSGVGAGTGNKIALGENSSYRMLKLFQDAASKVGSSTTARGRNPHYGLPTLPSANPRSQPSLYISWDGSDVDAHTPYDAYELIDPQKIKEVGEATTLMISVMSREVNW